MVRFQLEKLALGYDRGFCVNVKMALFHRQQKIIILLEN